MTKHESEIPLFDMHELTQWTFYRALVAEFIATFMFLYITVLTLIGYNSQVAGGNACGGVGVLGIAWVFGGTSFILVFCTSPISGGHINPAVTLGQLLARKVSLVRAVMYMMAQCAGAICGCALVRVYQESYHTRFGGGANKLVHGYNKGTGLGAEIIGTFFLVHTVFSATHPTRNPVLGPVCIGFAVFMVHLATIPITGTGINPARSFGAAVIYNKDEAWNDHWIFWIGPFIGASIAALYHHFMVNKGLRGSSTVDV